MNVEEQEVLKMICECLDLREKYVFRENVAPWTKSVGESSKSNVADDPFRFVPVEASSVSCPFSFNCLEKLSSHLFFRRQSYLISFT